MSQGYSGFSTKRRNNFIELPPVGAYVAEIRDVRKLEADPKENRERAVIETMIEITEGDYAGQYTKVFKDQDERFGQAKYKGVFRLTQPKDANDEDWLKRRFEGNLWCVEQSNPGYQWDWDEKKLKGKKIGISVRKRLYTYNGKDRETTEIGQFETVEDVKSGKCKPMRDRDQRESKGQDTADSTDGSGFTEVSATVDVPW